MSNAERNAEIIRRRLAKETPRQIAHALGLNRNKVIGVCYRAGLTDPTSPQAHDTPRPGNGGQKGEASANAVLTEAAVRQMRATYVPQCRRRGYGAFARQYGVALNTARAAVLGLTWAHVQ